MIEGSLYHFSDEDAADWAAAQEELRQEAKKKRRKK